VSRLLAFLQLCRFAAVFTAMADIFVGYLLVRPGIVSPRDFGLLLSASSCLYLAGMVFNDVFDRRIDAIERPKRPIPSGRVSLKAAVAFGTILIVGGLVLSAAVGLSSAAIAFFLVACIFLYDGFLKSTFLGPIVMGGCRFFNVLLGASTAIDDTIQAPAFGAIWMRPQLDVALSVGIYIAGVTWFAREEAGTSRRGGLAGGMTIVNLGLALLVWFVMNYPDARSSRALLVLALVALYLNWQMTRAVFDPAPGSVQLAVRTMLLWLIVLDATIVFLVREGWYGVAVFLLTIPANLLARFLAVT
jgi:4-hydroxybenzoate polyprenyltransferase